MRKTIYKCDLCKEEKNKTELTAFYFKCDIIPQRYVLDNSKIDECDKHICHSCTDIIRGIDVI